MIPRIIHQTWKTDLVPQEFRTWCDSWTAFNPGWDRQMWSDRRLLEFVAGHYPEFLDLYCSLPSGVMRADAGRYMLLHHFGGLYADIDTECLGSLDAIAEEGRIVLSLEPSTHWHPIAAQRGLPHLIFNGIMASPAGHPFWLHVLELMRKNRHARNVIDATGPCLLTAARLSFPDQSAIRLAPSPLFNGRDRHGNEPDDDEGGQRLARHHWAGTWLHKPRKRPVANWLKKEARRARHVLAGGPRLDPVRARAAVDPKAVAAAPSAGVNLAILIPLRDAAQHIAPCLAQIARLDIPRERIKLVFCEGDSTDDSWERLNALVEPIRATYRGVVLLRKEVGTQLTHRLRWKNHVQRARRAGLAKVRNHLIDHGIDSSDDWVLWIDADVWSYPADIVSTLKATGARIAAPHCVTRHGGPCFDQNTFITADAKRDHAYYRDVKHGLYMPPLNRGRRLYLDDLRHSDIVPLDSVGGTMLLVDAALHRAGLRFPEIPYEDLIETEGLARLARDLGIPIAGLPNVEILHVPW
ncbi:glycosyltransferase [Parvibaculum sp.]|uniref:glycosyltransferase n=1 Tax=Parvibaculum sp. TaxID=2024848 RepID=UPI00320D6DD4